MKSSLARTVFFTALALAGSFLTGILLAKVFHIGRSEDITISSPGSSRRSSLLFEKRLTASSSESFSSFTKRDRDRLIARLGKNPDSGKLEEEFARLLQYPSPWDNGNLFAAMQYILNCWGKIDSRGALEKVMGLKDGWGSLKEYLIPSTLSYEMQRDPSGVAALFSDINSRLYAYAYNDLISDITSSLACKSPDEAWKWMSTLPFAEQTQTVESFLSLCPGRIRKGWRSLF